MFWNHLFKYYARALSHAVIIHSILHTVYVCKLEKAMAPHSSTLAWKIPWMEEPGRLQSMGSLRVRHDWVTSLLRIGEGNGNPLQCSCLENPRDWRAWWAAISGVTQSRTQLKWLSSNIQLYVYNTLCIHLSVNGYFHYSHILAIETLSRYLSKILISIFCVYTNKRD